MITCPRCGYQAPDGSPYCPRCGYGKPPAAPAQAQQPAPAAPEPISEPPLKKKSSWIPWALLLIALAALVLMFNSRTVSEKKFMAACETIAVLKNDQTAMEATLSSQEAEITKLREAAAPIDVPTVETSVSTDTDEMSNYCNTMLTAWRFNADLISASGLMTFDHFDEDLHACRYSLTGSGSGSMILYLNQTDDVPNHAAFEMDISDQSDSEVLFSWAAVAAAYFDFVAPATALRTIEDYARTGSGSFDRYQIILDRSEAPIWKLDLIK